VARRAVHGRGTVLADPKPDVEEDAMTLNFSFVVWLHVVISLVPLVAGVPVVRGLLAGRDSGWWTDIFFVSVILTTASGFILPAPGFTPALGLGIISTVVILAMLAARYRFGLSGAWRWV